MFRGVVSEPPCACPIRKRPSGIIRASSIPIFRKATGRALREQVSPRRVKDVERIPITSARGKCKPFIKVEKDPERFAACNALSDELGPLDDPKKAIRVVEEAIGDEVNEVFGVITLDLHLRLKGLAETGRGEPTSVMAPIVPTLQAAVVDGAHAVIIFHVHPSGIEAEPSEADIETTEDFIAAFDAIDIKFLDHLIIGGDAKKLSYYSFAEDNRL